MLGSLHTADDAGEDSEESSEGWNSPSGGILFINTPKYSPGNDYLQSYTEASMTLTRGSQHPPGSVMGPWSTDNTLITRKPVGEIRVIRKSITVHVT